MFADEKAENLRPPSEQPDPDAATKRLKALGALTTQASSFLVKRKASAGMIREVAAQLQAEKVATAEATKVARHGACVMRQPDEPPAVEVGSHLEVLDVIEEPEEDGSISKEYSQWVAVVVVAAADGTAAHKKPTATGQMRKVNTGWFLVRHEDGNNIAEEWLRLPGDAFNNNARGSWRVDLDFEASGDIEGGGGDGGDERVRGDSDGGGGGNGDEFEDESGKEESGDEPEYGDSSDEDEDADGGKASYDGSDV